MERNPTTVVVLIDIDDTIEYLCKTWVKTLNKTHGTKVKYNDITEWDMTKFFPTLTKDQIYEPLHEETFWETVEPMKDAMRYVRKLVKNGFEVYLCTSTDYRNVRPKFEYIVKRYFDCIDWDHVIVCKNKQMIDADILIDDGIHNLVGGRYYKILFTAPHNKSFSDEDLKNNGMVRANNWRETYKLIYRWLGHHYDEEQGGDFCE